LGFDLVGVVFIGKAMAVCGASAAHDTQKNRDEQTSRLVPAKGAIEIIDSGVNAMCPA
jgi:uncharacterized membrane protein YadS